MAQTNAGKELLSVEWTNCSPWSVAWSCVGLQHGLISSFLACTLYLSSTKMAYWPSSSSPSLNQRLLGFFVLATECISPSHPTKELAVILRDSAPVFQTRRLKYFWGHNNTVEYIEFHEICMQVFIRTPRPYWEKGHMCLSHLFFSLFNTVHRAQNCSVNDLWIMRQEKYKMAFERQWKGHLCLLQNVVIRVFPGCLSPHSPVCVFIEETWFSAVSFLSFSSIEWESEANKHYPSHFLKLSRHLNARISKCEFTSLV
jgi:hypothetical protein